MWTLETGLGGAFTTEVREAWARVYRLAAVVMIRAADAAKHRAANASRQRSTAAAPLPKNEFGAPVAQDLLDEVNAAIAAGKRADLVRVVQHQGLPLVRQVWREGDRIA